MKQNTVKMLITGYAIAIICAVATYYAEVGIIGARGIEGGINPLIPAATNGILLITISTFLARDIEKTGGSNI